MSRVYVLSAYLMISVVAAEFLLAIYVFAGPFRDSITGVDLALPDGGAGLGHQMLGLYVMPVLVTAMLISSFDTRYKGSTRWALAVTVIYLLDVALVLYGDGLAFLHGLLAVVLAVVAVHAARRLRTAPPDEKWDLDDFR